MAPDKVSVLNKVLSYDWLRAEAQVTDSGTASLVGAVGKVTLRVHISVPADDLDGVLVGANGTVTADTIEHALGGPFRQHIHLSFHGQAAMVNVIVDTDGEVVPGVLRGHVFVHRVSHTRGELLGS